MFPDLRLIEFHNRERALEIAAEHRRAREARSPNPVRTARRRGRLARALHLR